MPVELNHTIVHVRDPEAAARFMSEVLGLPPAERVGPFLAVRTANGVGLDYMRGQEPIHPEHYAFVVSDPEFDEIFARVKGRGLTWWADPFKRQPGECNTRFGGRGFYFDDPDGHFLEVFTMPHGAG
jgi:catechol 2,3-dioxygenase-like lactoylglutathione lyase family enzyme